MMLRDGLGRSMETLRVSVTDRCDLRCKYCMPAQGAQFLPRPELLDESELQRSLAAFLGLGIRRIKFTGGEPLLRMDLENLISSVAGKAELGLTTNGTLLSGRAEGLWRSGLRRITISLDTLHPGHYSQITRGGDLRRVLAGIREVQSLSFSSVKINAVVFDQTEEELLQLAALSVAAAIEVRFIEYMPISHALKEKMPLLTPAKLQALIADAYGPLEAEGREEAASPAYRLRIRGARGRLGFISSVSQPFCGSCDRLRLQADGFLRLCMAHPEGIQLRDLMRRGGSDADLKEAITTAVFAKPAGHAFYRNPVLPGSQMSRIGG